MRWATTNLFSTMAAVVGMTFCGAASAQATWGADTTWDFGTPCNAPPPACVSGGVTLTVAGYGNGGSGGNYVAGTVTNQDPNGLGFRSRNGWGNETSGSPNHAFDNQGSTSNPGSGTNYGTTNEVLLLDFGSAKVNLTAIQTGWSQNDTDVMVFRWDGDLAPTLTSTAGPSGLLTAGWKLVSAKDLDGTNITSFTNDTNRTFDLSTGAGYNAANSADKVSSWWLVSSYFDGAVTSAVASANKLETSSKDYFKLLSFTGRQSIPGETPRGGVPEPASLALVGVALAGVLGSRRRKGAVPT